MIQYVLLLFFFLISFGKIKMHLPEFSENTPVSLVQPSGKIPEGQDGLPQWVQRHKTWNQCPDKGA